MFIFLCISLLDSLFWSNQIKMSLLHEHRCYKEQFYSWVVFFTFMDVYPCWMMVILIYAKRHADSSSLSTTSACSTAWDSWHKLHHSFREDVKPRRGWTRSDRLKIQWLKSKQHRPRYLHLYSTVWVKRHKTLHASYISHNATWTSFHLNSPAW